MLKKIEAIIREDKVNDVTDALEKVGIVGMNLFTISGRGRQGGVKLVGRAGAYQVNLLPKIQLNIVLSDRNLETAIDTICQAAYTGEQGDGLIFVTPVEEVIRVRTRERGQDAVMYPGDIDARRGLGKATD